MAGTGQAASDVDRGIGFSASPLILRKKIHYECWFRQRGGIIGERCLLSGDSAVLVSGRARLGQAEAVKDSQALIGHM